MTAVQTCALPICVHGPLLRSDPLRIAEGNNPSQVDSKPPSLPYHEFTATETRFAMLQRSHPSEAAAFTEVAQEEVTARYHHYKELSELGQEEKD